MCVYVCVSAKVCICVCCVCVGAYVGVYACICFQLVMVGVHCSYTVVLKNGNESLEAPRLPSRIQITNNGRAQIRVIWLEQIAYL